MPLRYNDLRVQTQAVVDAEAVRATVREHLDPTPKATNCSKLKTCWPCAGREFIATARNYNQEIAAYTELAAPKDVPTDRLVAMMIRTSAPAGQQPWTPSGVDQASATEPVDQSAKSPNATGASQDTGQRAANLCQRAARSAALGSVAAVVQP